MNASQKNRCPRCQAAIPADSSESLCPACLLSGVLNASGPQTATLTAAPEGSLPARETPDFPCSFGGYRLLGLLGRGGMGTVYEAVHLATGRRLALKTLGRQLDSPEMRQRFLREGRLAARVSHPNSLYVFGSEEVEGLPVITMEIAAGGTLKDSLKQRGPLPVGDAVDAILDVIAGLESALAAGVLHRDIKPSNCFVDPDGSVKVGDFGLSVSTLAKTDTFVTAHGKIMGTPAYASPEQLRGDVLDVRADIYSVGATLFTLLTNRAPFEGDNAVQVVANAVNQKPASLASLRDDVPSGLERAVARCLAKQPEGRFAGYAALRDTLLPFSSREPEAASLLTRAAAGWIDYLLALLPPYVAMMFLVGGNELLVAPLVERSLYSARYYLLLFGVGITYFAIFEGIWGAGLGKWLRGLRVIRPDGRRPGIARSLIRAAIPIACVEGVRMPLSMAFISTAEWTGLQTALYVITAVACGWIPALLTLRARPGNRFATVWDLMSGTRVVLRPKDTLRPALGPVTSPATPHDTAPLLGPYHVVHELVPGEWGVGLDPVLQRAVWLQRATSTSSSPDRQAISRPGRPRWLQRVECDGETWDAFEAPAGTSFSDLVNDGKRLPWSTLRHWLHDLASELWAGSGDRTLPVESSFDHVWITAEGRALLLDRPWPGVASPAVRTPVTDLAGQQRFLGSIAGCVESTEVPLHARPVLRNVAEGRFEKLSFLTGTLRGLVERPATVGRGLRAASLFMLPGYVWVAFFVGRFHDKPWTDDPWSAVIGSALVVLAAIALMDLAGVCFRGSVSQAIFRLAVVDDAGGLATRGRLLLRWAIAWLPLLVPASIGALLAGRFDGGVVMGAAAWLAVWLAAVVVAALGAHRGPHDRMAGTWVVRC